MGDSNGRCGTYESGELMEALAGYLKGAKLNPYPFASVSNPFLTSGKKAIDLTFSGKTSTVTPFFRRGYYGFLEN